MSRSNVSSQASASAPWAFVMRLPQGSRFNVKAKQGGGDCVLQSASEDGLVCLRGSTTRTVRREDIRRIRLLKRGRSAAVGLAIGALGGAGLGAGVGSAVNSSDSGSLLHVSGAKSAGVGIAIGSILGGLTGAIVGYSTNAFGGAIIYKH